MYMFDYPVLASVGMYQLFTGFFRSTVTPAQFRILSTTSQLQPSLSG